MPKSEFGSSSSVHQYFLDREAAGLFEQLWKSSLREYDEMEGIAWEWQSLDGAMVKAPLALASVDRNPTDREKGSKRSLLTDQKGVPLSIVLNGANTHDVKQLDRNHAPHIRPRGEEVEEKARNPDFKPKCGVVEVGHS